MSSPYTLILNDVQALATVAPFTAANAPVIRKRIEKLEEDALPLLLIVPMAEELEQVGFEGQVIVGYRVGLAMIFQGNMTLETGLSSVIDAALALRKAVNVTSLATATTVYDSDVDMHPAGDLFDVEGVTDNLDYSLMLVTYRSNETRN